MHVTRMVGEEKRARVCAWPCRVGESNVALGVLALLGERHPWLETHSKSHCKSG